MTTVLDWAILTVTIVGAGVALLVWFTVCFVVCAYVEHWMDRRRLRRARTQVKPR